MGGTKQIVRFQLYDRGVKKVYAAALALPLLLTACANGQNFSEVAGDLRVQGRVEQSLFEPAHHTLSLDLSNAQTGRPIDALDVELKSGNSHVIHAARQSKGAYSATFSDTARVEVLILTANRAAVIALQRQ